MDAGRRVFGVLWSIWQSYNAMICWQWELAYLEAFVLLCGFVAVCQQTYKHSTLPSRKVEVILFLSVFSMRAQSSQVTARAIQGQLSEHPAVFVELLDLSTKLTSRDSNLGPSRNAQS